MSLDNQIAGITCAEVLAALSDYVDGELADSVRIQIEAHVMQCTNCERFGGMFAHVIHSVRTHASADDGEVFARLRKRIDELLD
jgi:anti-sigma factor RsiW